MVLALAQPEPLSLLAFLWPPTLQPELWVTFLVRFKKPRTKEWEPLQAPHQQLAPYHQPQLFQRLLRPLEPLLEVFLPATRQLVSFKARPVTKVLRVALG
jgi:hypothetical protein